MKFILTGDQEADISQADTLLCDLTTDPVIGDEGHNADALVQAHAEPAIGAVIPLRSNRATPRECD